MQSAVKMRYGTRFYYFYDLFEVAYRIEKENLWEKAFERVKNSSYAWRIGIALIHLQELTSWFSPRGNALFVNEYAKKHKDYLTDKTAFSSVWRVPIKQRVFDYNYDCDVKESEDYVKELQKKGYTVREIEILSGISKSQVARLLQEE